MQKLVPLFVLAALLAGCAGPAASEDRPAPRFGLIRDEQHDTYNLNVASSGDGKPVLWSDWQIRPSVAVRYWIGSDAPVEVDADKTHRLQSERTAGGTIRFCAVGGPAEEVALPLIWASTGAQFEYGFRELETC